MIVTIKIKPQDKSTLRTILNNVQGLMINVTGDFKCTIEIDANFNK